MIPDEDSRLRKIERELYTTDIIPPKRRENLHAPVYDAPDDWVNPKTTGTPAQSMTSNQSTSLFKKIFFGSLGFLVIAGIVFGVSFLTGGNAISSKNVDITITTKSLADGGSDLPVNITITNRNKVPMQLTELTLSYPNTGSADSAVTRVTRDVGTIDVGASHDESFTVQLYGTQGSVQPIMADVQFNVSGSNAVYDATNSTNVTINSSPVNLSLNVPSTTSPNQQVPLAFSISGNGTTTLSNTALVVTYPAGFTYDHADTAPSYQNNVWYLGDLPPGSTKTITVYGSFAGGTNQQSTIAARIGSQDPHAQNQLTQIYSTLSQVVTLATSFVNAQLSIGGGNTSSQIPINSGDIVNVSVPWQNTLASSISNMEIDVGFSGSAYDPSLVQASSGYFDSAHNQIIWTKQQDQSFAAVNPGASGSESFSIRPKQFPSSAVVSNPQIVMTVSVKGYPSGGSQLTATNVDQKTLVLNSNLSLLTSTLHYTGAFANTGSMPPRANHQTTYTLNWEITNFRNGVSGVTVSTTLPTYVDWKGVVSPSSESSKVQYNSVTRNLVWNAGSVPAGVGSTTPARILSMQIGLTPSTDQQGTAPDLTGPIVVTGVDGFTGATINLQKHSMSTVLLNDGSNSTGADGQVQ